MNDICTACGAQSNNMNTITVKRTRASSALYSAMTGDYRRNKYGSKGDPTKFGRYGDVYSASGLCDTCTARIVEQIKTMRDFTAR